METACYNGGTTGKETTMTKVAFKIEVNPCTKEMGVFAFFPMEEAWKGGEMFASYSHDRRYFLCAKSNFNHRRWANFHQYIDLYHELVSIGHNDLEVLNKDWKTMEAFAVEDDFGYHVNGVEARAS